MTELKKKFTQGLPVFNYSAAGIDIGDTKHDVAINNGKGGHEVREYLSFTEDLEKLVAWLVSEGVTTVAMESTGIYWLNLYLMLEEAGIEPYLVNAKHVKNVTGRKKDDTDAIWLQKLHSCGLLQKGFQPDEEIRKLRTYVRQRKNLINIGSDCVRRMQKALELMNIKLHTVISDILGKTGIQMVEAILNGERSPDKIIKLKDPRIKASDEEIKKSLKGIWREEYIFMLQQAYDGYTFYRSQIKACEVVIESKLLEQAAVVLQGDITELGQVKKKPKKNQLSFNARPFLKAIVCVDLCEIDGISDVTALEVISEIGTDMNKWNSRKHFAAWLNLAPNTKITSGKIISSKMQKKKKSRAIVTYGC
ncbi:MAG: IS110 family transposase [Bacteroidales bacterium]|nr:IS110 family transposase [Bacteroidales bacterium]